MPSFDNILRKRWQYFILIGLFLLSFWIRLQPLKTMDCYEGITCLQALDPYYIYRMADYLVTHNLHLMNHDSLRYYPQGIDPHIEFTLPYYIPAIIYLLITTLGFKISFLQWAKIYPAFMGALLVFPMYLLGKELHNKKTGFLAAFLLSTSASIMYRTSAGFIEKEPTAGIFMLFSLYFFVRALKQNSFLSGILAGLCLAGMSMGWGGVQFIFFLLAGFTTLLLLLNKETERLLMAYVPTAVLGTMLPLFLGLPAIYYKSFLGMMVLAVAGLVIVKYLVEKYKLVSETQLNYVIPSLIILGLIIVIFGSLFSQTLAHYIHTFQKLLSPEKKAIIESTVAENNPGSIGDIKSNLSVQPYASTVSFLSAMGLVLEYFSLWILAMLGGIWILIQIAKNNDKYKTYIYASIPILLFFSRINLEYAAIITLIIVALFSKKWEPVFILFFVVAGIHGVFSKIRMMFFMGPAAALLGAYFLSKITTYISNLDIVKRQREGEVNIFPTILVLIISLILVTNLAAGYSFSKSIATSLNPNWQQAMYYLKNNTDQDSIIFSWWDYGYWFQTVGERTSVVDGGNLNATANILAARFFTRRNESAWGEYLRRHKVDYILVDYTLIGKYSAMSKIATDGAKIDSFIPLGQPQQLTREDGILLIFNLDATNSFWVPVDNNGNIVPPILFVTPRTTAYVKYICSKEGIQDLNPPNDKPIWDATCIMFAAPFGNYIPTDKEMSISAFAELYLWDGKNVPFVEKVFDNTEIKIFKTDFSKLK